MTSCPRLTADPALITKDFSLFRKVVLQIVFLLCLTAVSSLVSAQLGIYQFTGQKDCPTQNPNVTSQPANAVFSSFSYVNVDCKDDNDNVCTHERWNKTGVIDLTEYYQFSITANAGYILNLTSFSFAQYTKDEDNLTTTWFLRSSVDNYATDLGSGLALENVQTPTVILPAASFYGLSTVTFRIYLINSKDDGNLWNVDNVSLSGAVVSTVANPPNPTSDSPQCSNPGVTLTATGTPPAGETWYWQTNATGTSTTNSGSAYTVTTSGTYYIRSQDNTTLAWSDGAGSITVTVTPNVSTPVFTLGATSSRCEGAGSVTYAASAANNTGISYTLDATSLADGNIINTTTGEVTYVVGWTGSSVITATATGCNGPTSSAHTVTTNPSVGTPVFTLGATSTRCQGAGSVTYTATATNTTGITYSLDAASIAGGNSINSSTGQVTYVAGWSGTTIITANAAGCNGPQTATHSVTVTPSVGTPVFTLGASSFRCLGAATVNYSATASNSTGITYSLDALSLLGGNSINSATGDVTFAALWVGSSTITATATGCNGPRTATHTVTINAAVGTPVFTLGASSSRCQAAGTVTYTATASNSSGITYSLNAASIAAGLTINSSTGAVTYIAGFTGTATITASAAGCNGPTTASHTATTNGPVTVPVFTLGASSTRCQGAVPVTYTATANNTSGITYSLNAAATTAGNTINSSTGVVTYVAGWTGATVITASAAGCSGPRTATHSVTITPSVTTPLFTLGSSSTRCQGAATIIYTASATNTTGITYSLDATSLAAGNTINSSAGEVIYDAGWSGTSTITASAAGCNGPSTANHTVTVIQSVGTPVFAAGASSTRCQAAGLATYTATATNNTGITYSLDAASLAGGNTINASTGQVSYVAGWSGNTTVTATAAGCNGPSSSTHTVTVTPVVSTPSFSLGTSSSRCQGANTVTYTATAANSTGITYSLDAASVAGGNSINSLTGAVTYVAGWSGNTVITASAAGCNGPRNSTHTVTTTATVGTPGFLMGSVSTRLQGAGTVTYKANAANTTGITYSLDAASLAAGNTINSSTGAVTFVASWTNPSVITASAAGCGGPTTATHTVTVNSVFVTKQLYLSDPAQALDRIDPVATGDATNANTALLSTTGTTNTSFTMNPALCSDLIIKAGTPISVTNYVTISSGTMPANPAISAELRYGATNIITLSNPVYSAGILTWTGTLAADVTVPAGQAITLQVTTAVAGVIFRIDFDSQTKPSQINLPVSTYINITSLEVYSVAYPGGSPVTSGVGGTTKYIRAIVTDPFGFSDITGMNITITPGSTVAATSVAASGCTRTYEYVWNTPAISGDYAISAVAREGYENTVTNTRNTSYNICASCAPVAANDSASGAGGTPVVIDVLANDYDPNNNINTGSLTITNMPLNGSAYISNNTIVYLPNGTFSGVDTITYQICDNTVPTPLCATAQVFLTIDPLIVDICAAASKSHTYYIPYPEDQARIALAASASNALPSNNIQTVISIKVPYPGMLIAWDEWEDGYEANSSNPTQATTKVWGDGNPFNGIAPGYPSDIIPAGGSIVLDNTMNANPRNPASIFYDGKDKVTSNGQLALTQVCGEPTYMPVQAIKTNITSTYDFGQSFTIPLGEDFPSRDFRYTALFIRASQNNTTVNIDKDNNGTFETTTVLNEGESYLVNGGVLTGATVASDKPIGVELNSGGVDQYSIRNAPIFPATWYSHTYYTPVPTSDNLTNNPKDSSVVMLYNSLNRSININWYSGIPSSGVITIPAKSAVRFPLAYSTTAAYKFQNLTGESFTAIEIVDSYTPGGGGNDGQTYDWSFNLISEARLTDYATVAWAPGGLDLVAPAGPDVNGNPIWVTPTANTTIYVKHDGNVSGSTGLISPCGLRYDVAYNVNALSYIKIRDASDNDQSGTAVYTCNGAKIAAVYGEDPQGSGTGIGVAYWDVGSTIQPFCKEKIVIATDDYATSLVSQPVTISVLLNDLGFLSTIDPTSVSTLGLLQPKHGTVSVNDDGTILYIPDAGYSGLDTFEYRVCSTPSPIVCDVATVYLNISTCPSGGNQNIISGQLFIDRNKDGLNNDGGAGLVGVEVYLYTDGDCDGAIDANELTDSLTVDSSGYYQFTKIPEKTAEDNFDDGNGNRSCSNGTDGDAPWASNWVDNNDPSAGFCNNSQTAANTDADIFMDGAFGYAMRLKGNDVSITRSVNLNGATKAFLTFSYRRKSATLTSGEDVLVQASSNGTSFTTVYTIAGNGTTDANYATIYNQDITSYASATTTIRVLTNTNVDDADTVYIDNVSIRFLKYPQCYITSINTSTIPATYTLTTAAQRTVTINNGGSCVSQFDFGFGKPNVTVSGRLYNDNNGLNDGLVNGNQLGSPDGMPVYAYLTDFTGNVAFKATVNALNGTFSFPLAEIQTDYNLIVSTTNVTLGAAPPASFGGLSSTWLSVGEAYGTNNAMGTGNETGTPNSAIAIRTGMSNVTGVNFGVERRPNSDNHIRSINQPNVNQILTLNGQGMNPPVLSGSDPEECTVGCVISGRSVMIDTVPSNSELYYNNALLVSGQTITNFDPNLFQLRITAAALGDINITFRYSFVDAAGLKDSTPATYTLIWLLPLPAEGLTASATAEKDVATVKWSTISEHNTAYFEVERSTDNRNFTPVGNQVQAAGNKDTKSEYQVKDNIAGLGSEMIFYRVKLVDQDGKVSYSNIVAVRISRKPGVTVWPNPFKSSFTVSVTTEKETTIEVNMFDVGGKILKKVSQNAPKGTSHIALQGLDQLPTGVYLIEITDKLAGTIYQKLIKNN